MQATKLPDTIVQVLGTKAAKDLATWMERQLHTAQFSSQVQISAFVARQKVNVLMLEHVSNLLLADNPDLIRLPDESLVWRVPIDLTFPTYGRVGRVGQIDVDARYGKMHYDNVLLAQISDKAQQLAQKTLPTAK
ncbi:MAG: hypothetical protein GY832_34960 [Chloroflexi bacterium]|nr:hypothetical protein [Chloroflexota bacterium]